MDTKKVKLHLVDITLVIIHVNSFGHLIYLERHRVVINKTCHISVTLKGKYTIGPFLKFSGIL